LGANRPSYRRANVNSSSNVAIRAVQQRTRSIPIVFRLPNRSKTVSETLLDHLVGLCKQRRWHLYTKRLGGREVDHQLKFGGLHYG
jgi:hypothetical protein